MGTESPLNRARDGDADAFRSLVEPHLPGLYRTALLIVLDRELARDAVQEALIRAYRTIGRFRGEAIAPWLFHLVVNEARRLARRERRQPVLVEELPEPAGPPGETPEATVVAREERAGIWQAMAGLGGLHRTVLVLRYYHDLSEQEMAQILGVPPGMVKSRLHHARGLFQQLMGHRPDGRARRAAPSGRAPGEEAVP